MLVTCSVLKENRSNSVNASQYSNIRDISLTLSVLNFVKFNIGKILQDSNIADIF